MLNSTSLILVGLLVIMLSCSAPEANKQPNEGCEKDHPDMDWIIGTWEGADTSNGLVYKEAWTNVSKDHYAGDAETRKDGSVISSEHMEVTMQDGHHCFIVEHGESEPVTFEFTHEDEVSFVCRNDENDFPKQIEYRREGDELVAIISEGGPRIEFRFIKKY